MLRSLPPAGHPIPINTCLKILKKENSINNSFLEYIYPKTSIFLVSSGTAALTLTLKSLPFSSNKNEVIIPAYTCPSVAAAVIKSGLKPVLSDINPQSFQMNIRHVETKIRPETLAIIGVHLFGIPQDIKALKELADEKGIILIEDACQAFGNWIQQSDLDSRSKISARSPSQFLGAFGDIGILSFGRGKPLNLMTGGAVIVNNDLYKESIRSRYDLLPASKGALNRIQYFFRLLLYSLFFHPTFYGIPNSLPWLKLGETVFSLDFSVGKAESVLINLGNALQVEFEKDRWHRLEAAKQYIEALEDLRKEITFLPQHQGNHVALSRFPMVLKNNRQRDLILAKLKKEGLGATQMYPVPLTEQNGISAYFPDHQIHPGAIQISEGMLTLPVHSCVRPRDVEKICRIIRNNL